MNSSYNSPKRKFTPFAIAGFIILLFTCLICIFIILAAFYLSSSGTLIGLSSIFSFAEGTKTPQVIRPIRTSVDLAAVPTSTGAAPLVTPLAKQQQAVRPSLSQSYSILEEIQIPLSNPIELAYRLAGIGPVPRTLEPPESPYKIGSTQTFWAGNMDNNNVFQITAVLRYITGHAYFWIQENLDYNQDDLQNLAETFESQIYPTTRDFFGSEWTPGVDGDPHLYILYATGLGSDLAGSYSSTDEYPPAVHKYSNAHEMFYFNADNVTLGEPYTYGVLSHEFQHMILWNRDRNEATWLNEGFSELAAFINNYYDGGFDRLYARNPDIQLNDWPNNEAGTHAHYGASFLFVNYFMGRFGEEITKALVGQPKDSLEGFDAVLRENQVFDPLRESGIGADDVVLDWAIASYLNNGEIADGRYAYPLYPQAPKPIETETVHKCPTGTLTRDVSQYGVDYIRFTCKGNYILHFEGSIQTGLLPADPHSGSFSYWSNKGDEADMTLTRQFDFSTLSAPLSLNYWTWYDIESDYDYLYLLASTDGENWQILKTPSSTLKNPSGNSFGWAYTGVSGARPPASWIEETVDISQFAGETVYLRFEYITDTAVYGEGFLLDDVSIPQIGYFSDFEDDSGGWESNGWARVQNVLPQTYQLALIISSGETTTVKYLALGSDIAVDIPVSIDEDVDEIILVVVGTTRYTRQRAAYRFSMTH